VEQERQQEDKARSQETSYQQLLDVEQIDVPAALRSNTMKYMGSNRLGTAHPGRSQQERNRRSAVTRSHYRTAIHGTSHTSEHQQDDRQ